MNRAARCILTALLCITAAASVYSQDILQTNSANLTGVLVTGSLREVVKGTIIPVNFFDVTETEAATGGQAFATGAAPFYDPEWLNKKLNSTTVPVSNQDIEFGFGVNVTFINAQIAVTVDITEDGKTVYKVACTDPKGPCNITQPFSVVLSISSPDLVNGSAVVTSNNASELLAQKFDADTGNLTFVVGPLNNSNAIGNGGDRVIEFMLMKGPGDVVPSPSPSPSSSPSPSPSPSPFPSPSPAVCGEGQSCCKDGKPVDKGTECRPAKQPCEAPATCDGVSLSCPTTNEPVADGTPCAWVSPEHPMYGPYMVSTCAVEKASAAVASQATIGRRGAEGGWDTCQGKCLAGKCSINCSGPPCCFIEKPQKDLQEPLPLPWSVLSLISGQSVTATQGSSATANTKSGDHGLVCVKA